MKIRYIHFSPDEWITGCVGLENAERGLYITACAMIYSHGGPIPLPELKAGCRDHGHAFNRQLKMLLGLGKLSLNDGQISNKRCVNELQKLDKWEANKQQKPGKSPTNDPQNNPQAPKANGLDASHAGASARASAPRITNQGLDLSDPIQVRERSKPARLRAREGALEGASLASAATNHQSKRSDGIREPPWEQRYRVWRESGFWNEMWGPRPEKPEMPTQRTPDDIVAVDALVKETFAALKRKVTNPIAPILTVVDSDDGDERNQQLNELSAWVDVQLDGAERTAAQEVIEKARAAESREATPPDVRKLVDDMDELRRSQTSPSAAC